MESYKSNEKPAKLFKADLDTAVNFKKGKRKRIGDKSHLRT